MIPIIEKIDICQLASGDYLTIQVYKFIGKSKHKKAYLQANLHGCEIVGNAVIARLISFLSQLDADSLDGEIWLVPVCNPLGTNQKNHFFSTGRFNSYDGKDWNRIFWDYEKECVDLDSFVKTQLHLSPSIIEQNYLQKIQDAFAKELENIQSFSGVSYYKLYRYYLQSLCLDANYVIDIHSSSNQAIDYIYCFRDREESTEYFGLEYGILMNEYDGDAFDEAFLKPWLALEKQLAQFGRIIKLDRESWTLELGSGMEMNEESVRKGVKGIKSYLASKKMLCIDKYPNSLIIKTKTKLIKKNKVKNYYALQGGMIQERVAKGSKIKQGDRLYQILSFSKSDKMPKVLDIYAETDGLVFDISTNHAVNQGEYVLGIFIYG